MRTEAVRADRRRRAVVAALAIALVVSGCGPRKRAKVVTPRIGFQQKGIASWYGEPYHGRRAASGEVFDMYKMTAAHREWAFGTWVRVHNLDNGMVTVVRVNDRGPFVRGRVIDLSRAAAGSIDMITAGLAKVKLEVIAPPAAEAGPAPAVSVSARERYGVQVGLFSDEWRAQRVRREAEKRYGVVRLVPRAGAKPQWRVIVGEAGSAQEAEGIAVQVRKEYPGAFVVRVDGES